MAVDEEAETLQELLEKIEAITTRVDALYRRRKISSSRDEIWDIADIATYTRRSIQMAAIYARAKDFPDPVVMPGLHDITFESKRLYYAQDVIGWVKRQQTKV